MFHQLANGPRHPLNRLVLFAVVASLLTWLALFSGILASRSVPTGAATTELRAGTNQPADDSMPSLAGKQARQYLSDHGEYESLRQAVTAARFGLKHYDHSPFAGEADGYLGMSHVQNLNVWFDRSGATIRPTLPEAEQNKSWRLSLKLKAYGYGQELLTPPAIVSQRVRDNRIEYERKDCRLPIANCQLEAITSAIRPGKETERSWNSQSAIGNRQSAMTEWYENRAEGIEQGFTLNAPPARATVPAAEPLRLLLKLEGDLRAQAKSDGTALELFSPKGKAVLNYGQLHAKDARGKELAARMEAGAEAGEIALIVEDAGAAYPIEIDPITATPGPKLTEPIGAAAGNEFGDSVAIDSNTAIVGSWLDDVSGQVDVGTIYVFTRSGSSWTYKFSPKFSFGTANSQCGWVVAVKGNRIAYGCPGFSSNTGRVVVTQTTDNWSSFSVARAIDDSGASPGWRSGEAVALGLGGQKLLVGAPSAGDFVTPAFGTANLYALDANLNPGPGFQTGGGANERLGASVAIDIDDTCFISVPGGASPRVLVLNTSAQLQGTLQPNPGDGSVGDSFGYTVAASNGTVVVGAPLDTNARGTHAGAAYVFVRGTNGNWTQQQKLIASDGIDDDHFGQSVALDNNTMVVGSPYLGSKTFVGTRGNGRAYVFTRSINVWSQQTIVSALFDGSPHDEFGVGVGISGDTVISGAEHATNGAFSDAGAVYLYRLDCTAPYGSQASFDPNFHFANTQACPGGNQTIWVTTNNPTLASLSYQWRRNGLNLPGATSVTYTISPVSVADAGSYDCIVSNACGSEISEPVTLAVPTFSLNPASQNFGAGGSNGIVNVTSDIVTGCSWTAQSNVPWITVTSGSPGSGNGTVGFTVAGNTGPNQRLGTMTIAGRTFTVSQDGLNCSYSIAPTSQGYGAAAGGSTIAVTATAGCAWTAQSNDSWITVPAGVGGTGNGTLNYSVAANNGPARTGSLTVAGQTVTITQANGCTYAINPTSQNFPASVAAGAVNVTTVSGCTWTSASNAAFLTVTSGANGSGNGTVGYSVNANDTTNQRTGTITIAGQTFTVTQDAAAPTPTPTPTPNVVQFSSSTYSVQEDCTTVTITVNRIGDTSGAASVDYSTSDVTATERKDYIKALGALRFAAGETSKSFAVLINEDSFVEGNETFSISLSNPVGVNLGGPVIATVTIIDDATETAANPIDDPRNYVCQHYHDFLNRQPDQGGWDFWTNQITSCGTDAACLEVRRINVSASFFLSIEFQDTGYLVERVYKAAFGDATGSSTFPSAHQLPVPIVRLNEFLSDTQEIGQGLIVGQGNWQQQLENNKQAFTTAFVLRSRFLTAFPASLTAAQFVDALNANAGRPLSQAERDQLVNDLATNAKTRAQVLRAVAEDTDLNASEFNRAFVLMQYFGYLRRNPNDPQDSDHTGYDFWLTKLNQFNGNYINAEMVKAFITSIEYRQRFGP